MKCEHIFYSGHAVQRMFERTINGIDVEKVLRKGEVIADYPDDEPYPSYLVLGFVKSRPLHVVVAFEMSKNTCHVITVYEPDPDLWDKEFKKRKMS